MILFQSGATHDTFGASAPSASVVMEIDNSMEVFRVVTVTEMKLLLGSDDRAWVRIEILESRSQPSYFKARVWRFEHYRLQATFPQDVSGIPLHQPSDELILKELEGFNSGLERAAHFKSAGDAEDFVLSKLQNWAAALC